MEENRIVSAQHGDAAAFDTIKGTVQLVRWVVAPASPMRYRKPECLLRRPATSGLGMSSEHIAPRKTNNAANKPALRVPSVSAAFRMVAVDGEWPLIKERRPGMGRRFRFSDLSIDLTDDTMHHDQDDVLWLTLVDELLNHSLDRAQSPCSAPAVTCLVPSPDWSDGTQYRHTDGRTHLAEGIVAPEPVPANWGGILLSTTLVSWAMASPSPIPYSRRSARRVPGEYRLLPRD